jgi:hypothetical protein
MRHVTQLTFMIPTKINSSFDLNSPFSYAIHPQMEYNKVMWFTNENVTNNANITLEI